MMDDFFRELERKNMDALWRMPAGGPPGGERSAPYAPYRWSWTDIRPFMTRAAALVTPGPSADRRVVQLIHPELGPLRSASHSITANVQMVLPGEVAPPHRHTFAAIRFIIEGESALTFVDGRPVEMRPGDLVLTPANRWHEHENESGGPTLWMDALDIPVTLALRQMWFEPYTASVGPLARVSAEGAPVMSYPWTETEPELQRRAGAGVVDAFDDVVLDFTNPLNDGPVLPTLGCRMQLVRPGIRTRSHRHTYAGVYHVFRGSGATIVDGIRIEWKEGDFFTLPPFCWHEHHNDSASPAYLFSVTDAPVIAALNFHREEAYAANDGHQVHA